MRVCCPTTPSQYFHLLRRQMRDAKRIPLVVMTPKSTLRHPKAISYSSDLINGQFELVLNDPSIHDPQSVQRVLLCSGKVYYDLLAEQEKRKSLSIAIIRVEQLHPYPEWNLARVLQTYSRVSEICWVQEEPQNMGAWNFMRRHVAPSLPVGRDFRYIGRPERASPASGSYKTWHTEQEALVHVSFE